MAQLPKVPGLAELRELASGGSPQVTIAVLDGVPDSSHSAFQGADIEWLVSPGVTDIEQERWSAEHATHICSVIFGQPDTAISGVAPRCRGVAVGTGVDEFSVGDQIGISRAFELAVSRGANVIHCAFCVGSQTGQIDPILRRTLNWVADQGVLVVAPAGNDYGQAWCFPATSPNTLSVGSLSPVGQPSAFTNFGEHYSMSVMAPGEYVLGATPFDDGTQPQLGTSVAAPIVTGIVGLLMSVMEQEGRPVDGFAAARAIVASARPLEPPRRGSDLTYPDPPPSTKPSPDLPTPNAPHSHAIGGVVDPIAALELLRSGNVKSGPEPTGSPRSTGRDDRGRTLNRLPPESRVRPDRVGQVQASMIAEQSIRLPSFALVIGKVRPDLADNQLNTQSTVTLDGRPPIQLMSPIGAANAVIEQPWLAAELNWVIDQDGQPLYVLEPSGPYAADIHRWLAEATIESNVDAGEGRLEAVLIPGLLTPRTMEVSTGATLPVIAANTLRGFSGWHRGQLARNVVPIVDGGSGTEAALAAVEDFVQKVQYGQANPGVLGADRALNYSATNVLQSTSCVLDALADGLRLEDIRVARSMHSRPLSDCWDVVMTFIDPEDSHRSAREYRHTVDVADVFPVSVGSIRHWSRRRAT